MIRETKVLQIVQLTQLYCLYGSKPWVGLEGLDTKKVCEGPGPLASHLLHALEGSWLELAQGAPEQDQVKIHPIIYYINHLE